MRLRSILQLLFGIATFIPGVYRLRSKKNGSGGSFSSRYCYSVYLRHMVMADINSLSAYPKTVAELGPGDSLGVGLMSLLLGSEKYYAFDIVQFSDTEKNLIILDELIDLLKKQENIPDEKEFPRISPKLDNYQFPRQIFPKSYIQECLNPIRIERIKKSIAGNDVMIEYKAPWLDERNIETGGVEMIISQAVLEHFDELELAYKIMNRWLNKNGFMTHTIDFKSHGKSITWDGHWRIPNWYWFLLRGRRPYLINRQPFSVHKKLIKKNNFDLIYTKKVVSAATFEDDKLNKDFQTITSEDRETSGVFLQAKKTALLN